MVVKEKWWETAIYKWSYLDLNGRVEGEIKGSRF